MATRGWGKPGLETDVQAGRRDLQLYLTLPCSVFPSIEIAGTVTLPLASEDNPTFSLACSLTPCHSLPPLSFHLQIDLGSFLSLTELAGQFYLPARALSSLRTGSSERSCWAFSLSLISGSQATIAAIYGHPIIRGVFTICGVFS